MPDKLILEIAVETPEAAEAAESAGASRIELCADLRSSGLTPSLELMRKTRAAVKLPIHVMIRPRPGEFSHGKAEVAAMHASIELARVNRMDGIVLGVLTSKRTVDVKTTQKLIEAAYPLPVTFHRAFDLCADKTAALEDCIRAGAKRILTSGGAVTAVRGSSALRAMIEAGKGRIIIMPGGGINPDNLRAIRRSTGATEFHSGLGTVLDYGSPDIPGFQRRVRELVACLD